MPLIIKGRLAYVAQSIGYCKGLVLFDRIGIHRLKIGLGVQRVDDPFGVGAEGAVDSLAVSAELMSEPDLFDVPVFRSIQYKVQELSAKAIFSLSGAQTGSS